MTRLRVLFTMKINPRFTIQIFPVLTIAFIAILSTSVNASTINRQAVVSAFSPALTQVDMRSPFTLGNGKFAFTADVTGLQSVGDEYFAAGFPLETKARWAWHSRGDKTYQLTDANETYDAYGRKVQFPTQIDTAPAQWLRQNPHDLPLGRISLLLDGKTLDAKQIANIDQHLDLWKGKLTSQYSLDNNSVRVESAVHAERDALGFRLDSPLNKTSRLSIQFRFPRSYDFAVKNTPGMDFLHDDEHSTRIHDQTKQSLVLERKVDDAVFHMVIRWRGKATIKHNSPHSIELVPASNANKRFEFTVEYLNQTSTKPSALEFKTIVASANRFWKNWWQSGAFVDLSKSTDTRANELQRRIILSQYLLAIQSRAAIPTQETGLTSSSWYGKFHTEMAWWHYAHWILWNRTDSALPMLDWYVQHLDDARAIAKERGLQGARWPKMVGSDGRESPGGNALIIWNQPQAIHLADMLLQKNPDKKVLQKYSAVVEETAQAMSSMLTWDKTSQRFVLNPPVWIAQEIYSPAQSRNPAFELAYWRYGLETAQRWRTLQGLPINQQWKEQLDLLAKLPQKNGMYVAIESIPDTFDNPTSREDHPSMLAPTALWNDQHIDKRIMNNTLDAVIKHWEFTTKIWGWDYPMLAMTAANLNRPEQAVQLLLMESKNNDYLPNGHCPQLGADVPVYLPANAALLSAVAIMLEKDPHTGNYRGFPNTKTWIIRTEGF